MEFGLQKCGVLVLKRGKVVRCEGLELSSGKIINEVERGGYRYLGILELDKVKDEEMKQQLKKEYKRRLKLILSSKLHGRNKIMAVNTWAVAVLRYGAGVLNWTTEELKELDRKTRKVMTMIVFCFIPSEARLINQSGRRPERSESRTNSSEKYIYIYIYNYVYNVPSRLLP